VVIDTQVGPVILEYEVNSGISLFVFV
jgi:hypothetical protein